MAKAGRLSQESAGEPNEQPCACGVGTGGHGDLAGIWDQLDTLRECVSTLWDLFPDTGRPAVPEQATGQVERQVAVLGQRLDAIAESVERLWATAETDRTAAGGLEHRVDRLEGAFDSQWNVLRRLELEALNIRKELTVIARDVRRHLEASGVRQTDVSEPSIGYHSDQ